MSDQPCINTDRELWRERPGDYYADSIHVTQDGSIGINCGGIVWVMPVRQWHALARALPSLAELEAEAKGYRLIRAAVMADGELPGWLDEVLSGMADDVEDFDARVLGTESASVLKAARAKEAKPSDKCSWCGGPNPCNCTDEDCAP